MYIQQYSHFSNPSFSLCTQTRRFPRRRGVSRPTGRRCVRSRRRLHVQPGRTRRRARELLPPAAIRARRRRRRRRHHRRGHQQQRKQHTASGVGVGHHPPPDGKRRGRDHLSAFPRQRELPDSQGRLWGASGHRGQVRGEVLAGVSDVSGGQARVVGHSRGKTCEGRASGDRGLRKEDSSGGAVRKGELAGAGDISGVRKRSPQKRVPSAPETTHRGLLSYLKNR